MSKERKNRREEAQRRERVRALNAPTARTIAYDVLQRIDNNDGYANLLLPTVLASHELSLQERAFITDCVYGSLRWKLFLDAVIEAAHKKPMKTINNKLVNVLRIGTYQWLFMNGAEYACVNETVTLARKKVGKQTAGFINALMRKIVHWDRHTWEVNLTSRIQRGQGKTDGDVRLERLSLRYSHPLWIVKELEKSWKSAGYEMQLDAQTSDVLSAMLEADNNPPEVTLCVRPSLASQQDLEEKLQAHGVHVRRGSLSPYALRVRGVNPDTIEEVSLGRVGVEDEGSQIAALCLAYAPVLSSKAAQSASKNAMKEQWLDMCAGPGGKTALLAAIAQERSCILSANEPHEHRRQLVIDNLKAIDEHTIGEITGMDGREFGTLKPNYYDRILVDAPCSGLGALRRRPEARWRKKPQDIAELTQIQVGLLNSALDAAKPGGVVAYVTCSPVLAETRNIVDTILTQRSDAERLDAAEVAHMVNPHMALPVSASDDDKPRDLQLFEHVHDSDQMFISLIRKCC